MILGNRIPLPWPLPMPPPPPSTLPLKPPLPPSQNVYRKTLRTHRGPIGLVLFRPVKIALLTSVTQNNPKIAISSQRFCVIFKQREMNITRVILIVRTQKFRDGSFISTPKNWAFEREIYHIDIALTGGCKWKSASYSNHTTEWGLHFKFFFPFKVRLCISITSCLCVRPSACFAFVKATKNGQIHWESLLFNQSIT